MTGLPRRLSLDAWAGRRVGGPLVADASGWGARPVLTRGQQNLEFDPDPPVPTNWADDRVGYGILVHDDVPGWSAEKAGVDPALPAAVHAIVDARPKTVILYWHETVGLGKLVRYFPDGAVQPLTVGATAFGTGKNRLPRYVLIIGGPDVIPWQLQYDLGIQHAVGRLPFTGTDLDPYVAAMVDSWPGSTVDVTAPLIWTVDHGAGDITRLMRSTITAPLERAYRDSLPGMVHVTEAAAIAEQLCDRLAAGPRPPGVVVTSSHGATPLSAEIGRVLGLPVDASHTPVPLDDLAAAMPNGAVWFAQACSSAGGAGVSSYSGLIAPGSMAGKALAAVAGLGPVVSPAALRLLSRPGPVRAIFGHVEPTFDWTLRDPESGQTLTAALIQALSTNLYGRQPLGYILADYAAAVGTLNSLWHDKRPEVRADSTDLLDELTRLRLTALDRQSLVLLGDPTVTLPPNP